MTVVYAPVLTLAVAGLGLVVAAFPARDPAATFLYRLGLVLIVGTVAGALVTATLDVVGAL
jgi:hypothetical protein